MSKIILFKINTMEKLCNTINDINIDEEKEEDIDDEDLYDINKMIILTKSRLLTMHHLTYFFQYYDNNKQNYFKVHEKLLNGVFLIFSTYLNCCLGKVSYATFNLRKIYNTVYASCHIDNFLLKLRELYLNIINVDDECFNVLEFSFSIHDNDIDTPCILINKYIFSIMVNKCIENSTSHHIDIEPSLNRIHSLIELIQCHEKSIKDYNFILSNKTEQKRIFEGEKEESNKKIRLL